MIEFLKRPWPWYVAGPLIGLMVPALLIFGNKKFGISSSLRHICAICLPAKIPFFSYNWRKEIWNLFFVSGIVIGAFIVVTFFANPLPININPRLVEELNSYGISLQPGMVPREIFNWQNLATFQGIFFLVFGGFLIGFGTRYAGGCTSGHSIMGLSALQYTSLIATACFMIGGIVMANFLLPLILKIS